MIREALISGRTDQSGTERVTNVFSNLLQRQKDRKLLLQGMLMLFPNQ